MKKLNLLLGSLKALFFAGVFFTVLSNQVFAQEAVSDEDLKNYAEVMHAIDEMKATLQKDYNDLIKGEPAMAGGKRYLELEKAKGDEEKLAEIEATEEELAVYAKIKEEYENMTADFKESYTKLIKEDLGIAVYNAVTKELKKDKELKSKYEKILAEVKAAAEEEEEEEEEVASGE